VKPSSGPFASQGAERERPRPGLAVVPRPRPGSGAPSEQPLARSPLGAVELAGTSPAIRQLRARIARIAAVRSSVLIRGETGSGKGVVARLLHEQGPHWREPFAHVDCAALCPSLAESELFGHERGAFTGAVVQRRGRCELAAGGTLFLDEIGDIEPALQAKLLRVLQERAFERVGGSHTLALRARVVAATNRDLERAVALGRFRRDLYYRLRVVEIALPPLRERREDIPLLAAAAAAECSARLGLRSVPLLEPGFCARLAAHSWPGNVRELFHLVERCLVERPGERLEPQHLDGLLEDPFSLRSTAPTAVAAVRASHREEAERIAAALRATGGNVSRSARRLGLARSTLRYRIERLGLSALIPRD
jgi:transcriptional regulator with GAF, ATPase, and Fis domain